MKCRLKLFDMEVELEHDQMSFNDLIGFALMSIKEMTPDFMKFQKEFGNVPDPDDDDEPEQAEKSPEKLDVVVQSQLYR